MFYIELPILRTWLCGALLLCHMATVAWAILGGGEATEADPSEQSKDCLVFFTIQFSRSVGGWVGL
jgi:hypothetical protein